MEEGRLEGPPAEVDGGHGRTPRRFGRFGRCEPEQEVPPSGWREPDQRRAHARSQDRAASTAAERPHSNAPTVHLRMRCWQ
jgi:hypothetical protein